MGFTTGQHEALALPCMATGLLVAGVGKGSGLFTFKQRHRGVLPIHVVARKLLLITVLV